MPIFNAPTAPGNKGVTSIKIIKNWWGGFQGEITFTPYGSVTHWEVLLKSKYKIDGFWGAEKAAELSDGGNTIFSFDNEHWNGARAAGQPITIGFVARTGFEGIKSDEEIGRFLSVAEDDGTVNTALNVSTGARKIVGGHGSDRIYGSAGKDIFTGRGGSDAFIFTTAPNKAKVDKITDFNVKHDTIHLDDQAFYAIGRSGTLKKSAFWIGDKAHDADDRIIYNNKTGVLYYDADGSGAGEQIKFAQLSKHLKMTNKDFFVV